ncbi:hypothetical protein EDC56_1867 [Sinobacterium caligoides]|uniref:Uncharacterized protein n=1 Tax=Sinobacterium caligoides TaxID=933926 RepID=A0A3N2DNT3_9GAMM|nr:hypothetical protein [Sinobacterium caligoides]ROS01426.1 hypothetical protein EDC56_1867 [Sinobacterium caligoides]
MLVIQHFGMEFPRLASHLSTELLLDIAEAIDCQDFAYIHFENKKKKKYYHNKASLIRAVRHSYHEHKRCRNIILEQLLNNKELIKQSIRRGKK